MTSNPELDADAVPQRRSRRGLIIGLVLALLGAGAGFYSVYTGLILSSGQQTSNASNVADSIEPLPAISFVPLGPMTINVGKRGEQQLRFRATLEVAPESVESVSMLMPRILDVLNGYLRAVEVKELRDPRSLIMIRAQMHHRIQIVTGNGHVRDLLITEFVFI